MCANLFPVVITIVISKSLESRAPRNKLVLMFFSMAELSRSQFVETRLYIYIYIRCTRL